jgi:hypothetical protein
MAMMRINLALAFLTLGVALTGASPVRAEGRVVVLEVDGDKSRRFEKALTSMIKRDHDVVSRRAYDRAAERAGVEDRDGASIGKVADRLEADAVIDASLEREDGAYVLTIRVRDAAGKTAKKLTVDLAKPRLSSKAKKRLGKRVRAALADLEQSDDGTEIAESGDEPEVVASAAAAATPASEPEADKPARKTRTENVLAAAPARDDAAGGAAAAAKTDEPVAAATDKTRVAAIDSNGSDPENPLPSTRGKRSDASLTATVERRVTRPPAALRLEVGGSATQRTLSFTTRDDFTEVPPGYDSPPIPGVHVAGELYPLAFASRGILSGFGIAAEYDRSLLLTTRSASAMDVSLPTTQSHWSVGARFRLAFGKSRTSPSVTIGAGYGRRDFTVDRSDLPEPDDLDLPDVSYQYVDPGLSVRLPLGSRLALSAGGRALLMLSAGNIQDAAEYGSAKAYGGEASAGFDVMLTSSFLLNVSGYASLVQLQFDGNGARSSNRDGDVDSVDVGTASDLSLGGSANLGVLF